MVLPSGYAGGLQAFQQDQAHEAGALCARGRVVEESVQEEITFGGVTVHPGDIIVGDRSGVVVIPKEKHKEILEKAEEFYEKEESMIRDLRGGMSMQEVDDKYNYNAMLKKEG